MRPRAGASAREGRGTAEDAVSRIDAVLSPQAPVLWYLRLGERLGGSPFATGTLAFALLLAVYLAAGMIRLPPAPGTEAGESTGTALFFALTLSFLLGAATSIFRGAQRDLDALADPDADALPAALDAAGAEPADAVERVRPWRETLTRYPRGAMWTVSALGVATGTMHDFALGGAVAALAAGEVPSTTITAASASTIALWILMFQLASPLMRNAVLFSRIGESVRIDLFNLRRLTPFARTALRPTLVIIAIQAAYPLLWLGPESGARGDSLIGLLASLIVVVGLFFLPMRGIRRNVAATRRAAVERLDARLAELWRRRPLADPVDAARRSPTPRGCSSSVASSGGSRTGPSGRRARAACCSTSSFRR